MKPLAKCLILSLPAVFSTLLIGEPSAVARTATGRAESPMIDFNSGGLASATVLETHWAE